MSAPASPLRAPASPKQTWWQHNRPSVLISLGILGVFVLAAILFAASPPATWGVAGLAGHPLAVLVDPANPAHIYAGTEANGVAVSTDGGLSWSSHSAGLPPNTAVSALLIHGATVFAGTSAGVYSDNGAAWVAASTGLPAGDGVDALAFATTDQTILLAGTETNGISRSADGGAHWTAASGGLPANADIYALLLSNDGKTVFAATIGAGIFRSADAGQTWQPSSTGLPTGMAVFALAQQQQSTYLLAGTDKGLYLSPNLGQTWQASSTGLGAGNRVISLAGDSANHDLFLAGTDQGVYQSTNGGDSWAVLAGGIAKGAHVGVVAISRPANNQPVTLFAAADQLYRYPNTSSPVLAIIARILIFGALIGALIWVTLRQRRTFNLLMARVPKPPPPQRPQIPIGGSSTIRGGPPAPMRGTPSSTIRGGPPPTSSTPGGDA